MDSNAELLSTAEAAEFLKIKPGTLETWRLNKRYSLAYVKVGRLVKYRRSDLLAFVERGVVAPVAAA